MSIIDHSKLSSLIHQKEGHLTRELLLSPGGFGLGKVPEKNLPDATTQMVCGFCGTGCNLNIHLKNGEGVCISPTTEYPVNLGMACPKGWEALSVLDSPDRAISPLVKKSPNHWEPVDWDSALSLFTSKFKAIQEKHGDDSVAFLSTGQMVTEEMAFLGALAKFGMGMKHGDGNTRQCMASAVTAYKQSFGFDSPPFTYQDLEESDVLVFVGANPCIAHPIMWERVMRNPHSPEIIVVDPRKTETAMQSTLHLQIAPKSDLPLFYGIAQLLIEKGYLDADYVRAHTEGFDEFKAHVRDYPLERITAETGLSREKIERFVELIHEGKRVSFWWTMGVNQSYQGVRTAQAIINLALMTGNIGRPGTGPNSITGQCNAMGSRLFSNTTNLLGGHDFLNDRHRAKVADILSIPIDRIPSENSLPYHKIMEGILAGKIKGLWVICTNPAHSWINQGQARDILDRLDFLVVQDMYHTTETARHADLILPAAGWGEKEGTFINAERRIGRVKRIKRAPGQALSDFSIFKLIAQYWGCGEMFSQWSSPAEVFQLMKKLSAGQACDFSGIEDYSSIEDQGGIQWPFPASETAPPEPQRRLFEDGRFFHENGRARFIFSEPAKMPEAPSEQYPFVLLTGRGTASQWHTQTRTRNSDVLKKLYPNRIYVEINPEDARQSSVQPNDWIIVESQRGRLKARAFITQSVQPGQLFIPMHYEDTNQLTDAVFDPHSSQPSYKCCAVRISAE
ncbi:molybdopterin oxidoreductase family protein [Gimesia panareensis]|uniref:molybdopterin oxidoreductase family protein n=1 Tax=Gimesia panareensis TaxID=2527978 RepID=UPI001189A8A1|nr:nitrate reductase [Gimesia panareensis]QDU50534.1 Nitrate reductase [Gimesia panareensis]